MEKLIITAAICGAEVLKEHNPAVPYTVEECVWEARSAYNAGASIIHLHVRYDDGTPTQDKERFRVVMDAITEACPGVMVVSFSQTEGPFLLASQVIRTVSSSGE